jgi:hypothetical protein
MRCSGAGAFEPWRAPERERISPTSRSRALTRVDHAALVGYCATWGRALELEKRPDHGDGGPQDEEGLPGAQSDVHGAAIELKQLRSFPPSSAPRPVGPIQVDTPTASDELRRSRSDG